MQQPSSDQQPQIQHQIQFTNQHQMQQQPMVICPVQFVYHDARPDEQHIQPAQPFQNQTFLINVQNTPPWIQNRNTNPIVYMPQIQQMVTNNMQPYITQNMVQNQMYIQPYQTMMMQDQRAMQIPNLMQQNMVQNQIRVQEKAQEKMPMLTQMLQNQVVRKSQQPTQNEIAQMQRTQFVNMRPQMITVNPIPNQCTHKIAIPSHSQIQNSQIPGQIPNAAHNASQTSITTANITQPINAQSTTATQTTNNSPIPTRIPTNLPIATQIPTNLPIASQMPSNLPNISQMINNINNSQIHINPSIQMPNNLSTAQLQNLPNAHIQKVPTAQIQNPSTGQIQNLPTAQIQSIPTSQAANNLATATIVPKQVNLEKDAPTHINDVIAQVAAMPKSREQVINQNEIPNYIKNQIPEGLSVKTVYRPVPMNISMNMIRTADFSTQYVAPNNPSTSGVHRPKKPAVRPYAAQKRKIQDDRHEMEAQSKIYKQQSVEDIGREKLPMRVGVSHETVRPQSSNTGTQVEEKLLRNTVFVQARGRISAERNTNVIDSVNSNQIDSRINKVDRSTQNDYRVNRIENISRIDINNQISNSNQQIGTVYRIEPNNASNLRIENSSNQTENTSNRLVNSNINNNSSNQINISNQNENTSNRIINSNINNNSSNQINISNQIENISNRIINSNINKNSSNQINISNQCDDSKRIDHENIQIDITNNHITIKYKNDQTDSRTDRNDSSTQIEKKAIDMDTKHIEVPKVEEDIEMKHEDRDSPAQVVPVMEMPEEIKDAKSIDDKSSLNDEEDEKLSDLRKKIMINGNVYLKQRNTVEKFILTHVLDGHVIQESNLPFMIHKPMRSVPNPTDKEESLLPKAETDTTPNKVKQETLTKEETVKVKKETDTEKAEEPSKIKNKGKAKKEETKGEEPKVKEEKEDCDTSKVNEDNPFEKATRSEVKSWTVINLSDHLLHHNWLETAQMLREEEIDGESLLLVNRDQLLQVGINERHADVLSAFLERTQ